MSAHTNVFSSTSEAYLTFIAQAEDAVGFARSVAEARRHGQSVVDCDTVASLLQGAKNLPTAQTEFLRNEAKSFLDSARMRIYEVVRVESSIRIREEAIAALSAIERARGLALGTEVSA